MYVEVEGGEGEDVITPGGNLRDVKCTVFGADLCYKNERWSVPTKEKSV